MLIVRDYIPKSEFCRCTLLRRSSGGHLRWNGLFDTNVIIKIDNTYIPCERVAGSWNGFETGQIIVVQDNF